MMDLKTLRSALEQLEEERNIPREKIIAAIEDALTAAYKKDYGKKGQIIRAKFDLNTGQTNFYQVKIAVDESMLLPEETEAKVKPLDSDSQGLTLAPGEDARVRFNEEHHIRLEDARKIKKDVQLSEELIFPLETKDDYGRIAAQTAKQVMIQRIRAAERDSLFEEYLDRRGEIVTGRVARWEGGSLIIDLGRVEAVLPKSEQIPGDSHQPEERIRAMILDVKEVPSQVRIVLSRTHPDFIRALFELEVPEVAEKIIEIKAIAREAGYRTKCAVNSLDPKVDPIGACVGIRGSRIKNIVDELGGEKIDIVRWNDSSKILIGSALKPAEVSELALCFELGRSTVVVTDDQLSLAIGKRGQNVRLAARLTGWDIEILTPEEFNAGLDILEKALREVPGVDSTIVDKIVAMGMVSVLDVEEVGADPLVNELGLDRELVQKVIARCSVEAKKVAAQQAEAAKEKARAGRVSAKADAADVVPEHEEAAAAETPAAPDAADEQPASPPIAEEPLSPPSAGAPEASGGDGQT